MRHSAGLLLAAGILACPACFETPAPKPQKLSLDTTLFGAWDCTSPNPQEPLQAQLTVLRFDQGQYYAEWKEEEKLTRYRAYPARFKGVTVAVVIDLDETKYWTPVRPAIGPDKVLTLDVPAKRITDIEDDSAAVAAFSARPGDPETWQAFARCQPH